MMRYLVILLFFSFLTSQALAQGFEEQQQFKCYENSQIKYDSKRTHYKSYSVIEGDQLVFEYTTDNGGDPGNHSRMESKIVFQVEKGIRKFQFSDQEITEHSGIYIQFGQTMDRGIKAIDQGQIKGKFRADGLWEVEIDVIVPGRLTKKEYHFVVNEVYSTVDK